MSQMKRPARRRWKMWACLFEFANFPALHNSEESATGHAKAGATVFGTKCSVFPVEIRDLPRRRRK